MIFEDRQKAGILLAKKLTKYKDESTIVLALPRGGVPVGFEIAKNLNVPLDVIVARKISLPYQQELGIGAIAQGNVKVFDKKTLELMDVSNKDLENLIIKETEELKRRVMLYRGSEKSPSVENKTVILVDDGLATGVTARAAIEAIKKLGPKKIIFATPVCVYASIKEIAPLIDGVVCLEAPLDFMSVGTWYREFNQITDEEVLDLLNKSYQYSHHSRGI